MNILILNWKDIQNPEAGGAEVITFILARRLVKEGHKVTVFTRVFPGAAPEEDIDGVSVIRRGGPYAVYAHALRYLAQRRFVYDRVIDMVNTLPWFTPLVIPADRRILYVNQLAQEVFEYELSWPFSMVAKVLEPFLFHFYRNTDTICYSESTRRDLMAWGIPGHRIQLFPLGLDHERYVPGQEKSSTPLFVFVARLVRMKRADLVIDAMKEVLQVVPNAQLVIIGRGPEEQALLQKVQHLGLSQHVSLLHRTESFLTSTDQQAEKVQMMQRAWALTLPSVKEGWGMVVTEAAACGTPAIVSNVTGLRDSTKHEETGLVVSTNPSPQELAEAMVRVAVDATLRERLSAGALRWAATFHWERSYQEFCRVAKIQ